MPGPRDVHRASTFVLSLAMAGLGVVMLVITLAGGGGPLSIGVLMGTLFLLAGAGRAYITHRGDR